MSRQHLLFNTKTKLSKHPIFNSVLAAIQHTIYTEAWFPDSKLDAEEVTYATLVELLQSHYMKKQSIIVHRVNFNCCSWKTDESIAEYVAALRELALTCSLKRRNSWKK